MKKFLGYALALSLLSLPLARAHADEDLGEKAATMIEKVATLVDANKDNCDAMGGAVGKFLDDSAATMAEMKEKGKTLTQEQKDAFKKKYGQRIQAAMQKMQGGAMACKDNAKVKAAFEKLKDAHGGGDHGAH